jgi:hypothetical protein
MPDDNYNIRAFVMVTATSKDDAEDVAKSIFSMPTKNGYVVRADVVENSALVISPIVAKNKPDLQKIVNDIKNLDNVQTVLEYTVSKHVPLPPKLGRIGPKPGEADNAWG